MAIHFIGSDVWGEFVHAWWMLWMVARHREWERRYRLRFPDGCSCSHGGSSLYCDCHDIDALDGVSS